MLIREILPKNPILCTADAPLPEVVRLMMENNCPCVPIVESNVHKNPIGVVTEHDICLKSIAVGINPLRVTAGRVMNGYFETVSPETDLKECFSLMKKKNLRYLIIADENNVCCGTVNYDDVARFINKSEVSLSLESFSNQAIQINYLDRIF